MEVSFTSLFMNLYFCTTNLPVHAPNFQDEQSLSYHEGVQPLLAVVHDVKCTLCQNYVV